MAPAILLMVAILQFYLALTGSLSPWKGGGFGMFSTIASPSSRVVRAYLLTEEERIPVLVPERFRRLAKRIRTYPTEVSLNRLGQSLSTGVWVPYHISPSLEQYKQLRNQYFSKKGAPEMPKLRTSAYSLDNASALNQVFERMKFVRMLGGEEQSDETLDFKSVEVELWQLDFEREAEQLSLKKLLSCHLPRYE